MGLATNVCTLCRKLTDAPDLFLAAPDAVSKFTVTYREPKRRRLDALLASLAQHRWEKENYQYVQETCHQDNLRHLVDIRKDLKLLLGKVEKALAPPDPDA
jgi:hypothetical protein